MSQVSRSASKLKFQTADVPTQSDFTDLHDSVPFYDDQVFTALSGSAWDGSNKTLTLSSNAVLTFASTKRNGSLMITQDGTGGRTLSINGTAVTINDGANEKSIVSFMYNDVAAAYIFFVTTDIVGVSGGVGDVTAPGIFSITAIDATHIEVVFNEVVTATTAGWTFTKNGGALTLTSVSGLGDTWTFLVGTMLNTDTIAYSYNSASGNTVDGSANELASGSGSVTNSISGGGSGGYANVEAFNYFTAVVAAGGTLSTTEKDEWDAAVTALKADGTWTALQQVNPRLGGTLAGAAIEAKSATTKTTWVGTPVANSDGVTYNGSSNYGILAYNPSADANWQSMSFGACNLLDGFPSLYDFGVGNSDATAGLSICFTRTGTGFQIADCWDAFAGRNTYTAIDALGFIINSRTSASLYKTFLNGTLKDTASTTITDTRPNGNVFEGAFNEYNTATIYYGQKTIAFSFLGAGLTDGQVATLNTTITTFLTNIGRL